VKTFTVWVPIAHLEIAQPFSFGPVLIDTISKAMIDTRETIALASSDADNTTVRHAMQTLRDELQGLAAVVIHVEAEIDHGVERALEIADAAIGLLRFFSIAALTPWHTCPCAILGSDYVPRATAIIMSDGEETFSVSKKILKRLPPWQMTEAQLQDFQQRGLANAGSLLAEEGLSEFQATVRSSLLAYSKGTTLTDLNDRLVYTFSALENLLLRDNNEPIQQNLGERAAFLLMRDHQARMEVVRNVKDAYHLRSQYIHHRVQGADEKLLEVFIRNAHFVLDRALRHVDKFQNKLDFLSAIDRIKFGGLG
jgi:hypothetical protein